MRIEHQDSALRLVDDLIADGVRHFTFQEALQRSGRSPTGTANLLRRMTDKGLIERVRQGHYAIRELGVLGTTAVAEDLALAVGAAFAGQLHRIAYRSALDEHDLLSHPTLTVQVAAIKSTRACQISDQPLRVVLESVEALKVGAMPIRTSMVSDLNRALLDAAARPQLVGGSSVLVSAVVAAGHQAAPNLLMHYAKELSWTAALRRIGSIADTLKVNGLSEKLAPLLPPKGDIDLAPSEGGRQRLAGC